MSYLIMGYAKMKSRAGYIFYLVLIESIRLFVEDKKEISRCRRRNNQFTSKGIVILCSLLTYIWNMVFVASFGHFLLACGLFPQQN